MQTPSQRIQLAQDAESQTIFVVPFGGAFLKVYAWQTEDGDYDDDNIRQVDLFADKACTRLVAEEIDWEKLSDLDSIFLEIRTQQLKRDARYHTNEYGELIAHAITVTPRDVEPLKRAIEKVRL